jgi:virginiamycin B lyase
VPQVVEANRTDDTPHEDHLDLKIEVGLAETEELALAQPRALAGGRARGSVKPRARLCLTFPRRPEMSENSGGMKRTIRENLRRSQASLLIVRGFLVVAAFAVASGAPANAQDEAPTCATVDDCIKQLQAASLRQGPYGGITGRETQLSAILVKFGAPAVEALVTLLDSPDKRTAGSAAHALSKFGEAARPAIDALARSLLRGNGWASGALSNTKDPKAIPPLVAGALAGEPTAAPALMRMGPDGQRAAAQMLAQNTHVAAISEEFMNGIRFGDGDRSALVAPLVAVVRNEKLTSENRVLACRALGALGRTAVDALPALRTIVKSSDQTLAQAATTALSSIGDPERIPALIAQLRAASTRREAISAARELSTLGPEGRKATPLVVERAHGASWDEQVELVDILASFADVGAVPFMIDELKSPSWRVTMAAVRGLGRMGGAAKSALPALDETARRHWLPRIRQYAGESREALAKGGTKGKEGFVASERIVVGPEVAARNSDGARGSVVTQSISAGPNTKMAWSEWSARLPAGGTCRGPKSGAQDAWKTASDLAADLPAKLAHLARNQRGYFVTYPTNGGLLVGTSRGEFGGEVVWVKDGREETVTRGNVFAIVDRPWGLVLLQGLAHLMMDYGRASILTADATGKWTSRPFLELPADPYALRELPDGGLAIATKYGTLTLDGTGAVQSYDCVEVKKDANGEDADLPPAKKIAIKTYEVPTVGAFPGGLAVGPDRALWFTEKGAIGRLTTSGAFTEYPVPTPDAAPTDIVAGPDGALWFTEQRAQKIGRITTAGVVTEYELPHSRGGSPFLIVVGFDKALWFSTRESIGRITTTGTITLHRVPDPNFGAAALAAGPDGAIWAVVQGNGSDRILRLSTKGEFSERAAPKIFGPIMGAVFASDGALWFTTDGAVARATSSGTLATFSTPGVRASRLAMGADGALWTSGFGGGVGRMTLKGEFTRFDVSAQFPGRPVTGPDGAIWLTDGLSNRILRLQP